MSTFYVQALRNWSLFLQRFVPTTTTEILNQTLFFNSLFTIKRKPIVVKSFILSKLLFLRDIWDNERHDLITKIQLWSKLNVKSNWISEWMLIKTAVPDSLMCALKHDNIISNSNNDLKISNSLTI